MNKENEKALEIKDLNVFYKEHKKNVFAKSTKIQTLYDVSLSMEKGEVLGLVGESGSGKTTLARTIVGINRNYSGEIAKIDPYPQMVFQDPYGSLNPGRTIRWILEEALKVDRRRKWTAEERKDRILEVCRQVELPENFLDRYPGQLSGGQRQRVGIGLSLMQNPQILIADEPVSALDVTIQAQILELLDSLHKKLDLSILFISHDLRVVYNLCDHVAIMQNGRIVEYGPTDSVYRHPQADYTRQLLHFAGIS